MSGTTGDSILEAVEASSPDKTPADFEGRENWLESKPNAEQYCSKVIAELGVPAL
jgi:hypothetical protein